MAHKPTAGNDEEAAKLYQELVFGEPAPKAEAGFAGWVKAQQYQHGYQQLAKNWLWALAGIIVLTIGSLLWLLSTAPTGETSSDSYSSSDAPSGLILLVVKAIIILIPLLYALRFAARSYRINKHLEVVYTQRWTLQRSLVSYLDLAESPEAQDKMLLKMTSYFYKDIETGYITKKDGLGDKSVIPEVISKAVAKR